MSAWVVFRRVANRPEAVTRDLTRRRGKQNFVRNFPTSRALECLEALQWITKRLLERGHGAPKYHMSAHHPITEAEATNRVVALSQFGCTQFEFITIKS